MPGEGTWAKDRPCIICHGRVVFGVAVPGDEPGLFWMADVCVACSEFHDEIAQRIREQLKR
jgi:hypothetical protein